MFDVEETIRALERMIFHSKADFQHALAIKIAQRVSSQLFMLTNHMIYVIK